FLQTACTIDGVANQGDICTPYLIVPLTDRNASRCDTLQDIIGNNDIIRTMHRNPAAPPSSVNEVADEPDALRTSVRPAGLCGIFISGARERIIASIYDRITDGEA